MQLAGKIVLALSLAGMALNAGAAQTILFYYSSADGFSSTLSKLSSLLSSAGHSLTVVDVGAGPYCPTLDAWAGFDQVWDARWRNVAEPCGSGTASFDAFDACWQSKADSFLNGGGRLVMLGQNSGYDGRMSGINDFLRNSGAMAASYANCSSTTANDVGPLLTYTASTLPGAPFYCHQLSGGLPVALLNGSSLASLSTPWVNYDANRALAAVWSAGQMSLLTSTGCAQGTLAMVMNSEMFMAAQYDSLPAAKAATDTFYLALESYVQSIGCLSTPTMTATLAPPPPSPTATPSFSASPSRTASPSFTQSATPLPALPTASATPTDFPTAIPQSCSSTVKVPGRNIHPLNVPIGVTDSLGGPIAVRVFSSHGRFVRDIYKGELAACQGLNLAWDCLDHRGSPVASGLYILVLRRGEEVIMRKRFIIVH